MILSNLYPYQLSSVNTLPLQAQLCQNNTPTSLALLNSIPCQQSSVKNPKPYQLYTDETNQYGW